MSRSSRKPLADRARTKQLGPGCLRLFFLPFFLAGAGMLYGFTLRPLWRILDAQRWVETPCVIEASEVRVHSGDGTTYSVQIRYQYYFDGQPYLSERYHFSSASSSGGRQAKQEVVDRLPEGTETICFVNPTAPHEAVIDRGWQWEILLLGGFASIFALVGGLGIAFAGRLTRSRDPVATTTAGGPHSGGPGVLKPKSTPVANFVGILIAAFLWNGFVSVFIYLVFFHADEKAPLFAKIIISLFGLIGLILILGVFSSFLALFNPRIRITAHSMAVPLGGEFQFTWVVTGRSGRLRKLRVVLEGREEATYRRGTDTSTDTKVFAEIPVFETGEREFLAQGSARVVVPPALMHTFDSGNNKILWRLRVRGEIPRWPDVDDEYPITVLPQPQQS